MLTHFGTLFAAWHIYHYLTFDVSRGTPAQLSQMFHVERLLHSCTNFIAHIAHSCAQN